jgi:hypothetical protein
MCAWPAGAAWRGKARTRRPVRRKSIAARHEASKLAGGGTALIGRSSRPKQAQERRPARRERGRARAALCCAADGEQGRSSRHPAGCTSSTCERRRKSTGGCGGVERRREAGKDEVSRRASGTREERRAAAAVAGPGAAPASELALHPCACPRRPARLAAFTRRSLERERLCVA